MVFIRSFAGDVLRLCGEYGFVIPLYPAARTEDGNNMTGSVRDGRMKLSTELLRECAGECGLVGEIGDFRRELMSLRRGDVVRLVPLYWDSSTTLSSGDGGMILTSVGGDCPLGLESDVILKSTPGACEIRSTLLSSSPSLCASSALTIVQLSRTVSVVLFTWPSRPE